jgi:hypothetical protein
MNRPDPDDESREADILRALLRIDERMASIYNLLRGISFAATVLMVIAIGLAIERWKETGWSW